MHYYGIFDNGNYIDNHNLVDLAQVPGLKYFLKLEHQPINNKFSVFTLIHSDGKPNFLRVNDIALMSIGVQYWDNNRKKTMSNFTFYDYRLEETFQEPLSTHLGPRFVREELIPFMNKYVNNIVSLVPKKEYDTSKGNEQKEV